MPRLVHLNDTVLPMGDVFAVRDPTSVATLFVYSWLCAYIAVNLCIHCATVQTKISDPSSVFM